MIKIIKCKKEINLVDSVQYTTLLNTTDHIIFDMIDTKYISASMIGILMEAKRKEIQFDLMLSSQVEYILQIKQIYNYLTGEE
jgi:hypothetical protein